MKTNPLTLASGYRSYIAGWSIVAIGAVGMMDPPYQIVFGESLWTVEAWNLLQQAVTPLIGLAVVFLRSAISKISPMLASAVMPMIQSAIEKAVEAALEKLKPSPTPKPDDGGDLVFTDPVKVES